MLVAIFENSIQQPLPHPFSGERPCSLDHQGHMCEAKPILGPQSPHDGNWTRVYLVPKPSQSELLPRIFLIRARRSASLSFLVTSGRI